MWGRGEQSVRVKEQGACRPQYPQPQVAEGLDSAIGLLAPT